MDDTDNPPNGRRRGDEPERTDKDEPRGAERKAGHDPDQDLEGLGQAGTAEPQPGIAENQGGGIEGAIGGGQSGQGGG